MNAPPNTVVVLDGTPYQLRWDKAAMFRADEIGLFDRKRPGIGLAQAAKYVFAMLPAAARERYTTPEAVAVVMPPLVEVHATISAALEAGREATSEKNVFGSTSGPLPASSSA